MILHKNHDAIDRKHFLLRAVSAKNMSQSEADEELKILEPYIQKNLAEQLVKEEAYLRSEIGKVKQIVIQDGDMKRAIAKMLIKFLEPDFSSEEIKGIMRQGYKLQRLKN